MIQNYKQTDPRWAGMLIGQGSMTMAEGGCGVCAIADVVSVLPPVVATWMDSQGFIYPDAGTVHEGVVPTLEHYGSGGVMLTPGYINGQMSSVYFSEAFDHVAKGFCAIFLMGGTETRAGGRCRNDFWSKKGHYICICGARNGGELLAHDPAYAARDGWHSIVDYGGAYPDSYNGNTKKIWLTTTRWRGGDLVEDGLWGPTTTKYAQKIFGTTQDGIVSNQNRDMMDFLPNCQPQSWEFVVPSKLKTGSELIRRIQARIGATVDGFCGSETVTKLQMFLGVEVDGSMGGETVTAFQRWLNTQ